MMTTGGSEKERSGISLPEGQDAEVRYVTILKCDLVDSTRTKRPLDLDAQFAFQRRSQQLVTEVATRFDANIERFEGDAALIVFGFPQSREDAAESAVRLGLELVRAIGQAEIVAGNRLHLRVGIASGQIAVLTRPSHPKEDGIVGLTIDLAERLRAEAKPDEVVIADSTKRLAGAFFHYADLGSLQPKGFDEGVRAWRVAGTSQVVSRFEAQRRQDDQIPLVGREDALGLLTEAWESTLAGRGQAVCLIGDAGIGKSRLARAALDTGLQEGAMILHIDCTPSTVNTPLFPIGVLLRHTANIPPTSSDEDRRSRAGSLLGHLLPEEDIQRSLSYLAPLFGLEGVPVPAGITPGELREQTITTIVKMVRSLAAEQLVIVLCEDLHWSDDTTATVVSRLCEQIQLLKTMVVITMRPSADISLPSKAGIVSISLQPLERPAANDLVRSVARGYPLSIKSIARIIDRAEGVPLLLEEMTRSTLEAGSGEMGTDQGSVSNMPASLQLVVQSRLSRWPKLTPIVQSASILGRDFSLSMLQRMLSLSEAQVASAVERLAGEGLFEKPQTTSRDRARFKHTMICEAVYNTLLASDRQRLHSHVADLLTRDYRSMADATPDVIAEHLCKSTRFTEAINIRLTESARTAAQGAYVETEGHCAAALALIPNLPDSAERTALQFRLLIQLGVALTGRHGYSAPVVEDAYRRAQEVCGDTAEAEMLYPIMRGLATVNLVRGDLATAYDLSVQASQLAEQSKRVEFRIDAMSVLCYTTFYYGRLDDCLGWIRRCLELYQAEHGERLTYPVPQDAATAAIALLPTVAWLLGDWRGSEQAVLDGLAHVERLNRNFDRALMRSWIAGTRYTQRRYSEALESAAIAIRISEQHGYREWYGIGTLVSMLAKSALGPDPEAITHATAICAEFAREGIGLNASYYLWALARAHVRVANLELAGQLLDQAFRRAESSRETRMNAELVILQAELEQDDVQAASLLGSALALAEGQGDLVTALRAIASLELRSSGDASRIEFARATLDMVDAQVSYTDDPNWVMNRLAYLQQYEQRN